MFGALRRKALTILTVSEFTKMELIRLSGQREQDIRVIYTGVDVSQFGTQNGPNPHPRPFVLCVGNVKPHKNVTTLMRAFKLIKDKVIQDLVIVGKTHGFITKDDDVWAESADLGARVHFTGYVKDDLLQQYLSHADALVMPSLYEGFGLPAVEAMASGCPVIASNTAALPEICDNAVLYCNPYSATDVANKIRLLVSDVGLQEDLRCKGRERASQFTWSRCGEQTLDAIEQVLQSETKSPRHQADNGARQS
jgi:glycosyltransferase involved in cell wall biosynthesis